MVAEKDIARQAPPADERRESVEEGYDDKDEELREEATEDGFSHWGEDGGEVSRVPSQAASKASVSNVASIPDGGVKAWLQVVGSFMLFFNTWGIVNTFGVYQTYYENGHLFKASSSDLSWLGSIEACLLFFISALAGPLYDAGHFKFLLYSGSALVVFGQMMLSLAQKYWHAVLAQGVCTGLGAGLLFVPSVAILSTYFKNKLSFAVGVAACGSSLGGVIYPIVFHQLQPNIGFAWTTRVIGFIELATLSIPLLVMRVRVLPSSKRKLIDMTAWKQLPYVCFVLGAAIIFTGLYIPFFYIQFYSISTGIMPPSLGFYMLAILNSASIFGRTIPNFLADKIGPFNVIIPCTVAACILSFALTGIHSVGGIIVFCVLYGFFTGTFVSLPTPIFVALSPSRGVIGTRMGMGFTVMAVGVLVGSPIAGAILGKSNFAAMWCFGGATTGVGSALIIAARISHGGWKVTDVM